MHYGQWAMRYCASAMRMAAAAASMPWPLCAWTSAMNALYRFAATPHWPRARAAAAALSFARSEVASPEFLIFPLVRN